MELPEPVRPMPQPARPGEPPSLVELIRRETFDAELGALVWLLVEQRIPLVVGAPADIVEAGLAAEVATGVLRSIRQDLASGQAAELTAIPLGARAARELVHGDRPGGVAVGATLADIRSILAAPPAGLTDDELSFLGCVLLLERQARPPILAADPALDPTPRLQVSAAHYVRPLHRDEHGHAQLLPPAVLAIRDPVRGGYEHFAWGVLPEIAARLGRRTGDLEADLHHRRDDLAGLVTAGVAAIDEVRDLIAGYRVAYGHAHGGGDP